MKKLPLTSPLSKKTTSIKERKSSVERTRTRTLRPENLEPRELLSVSSGNEFLASDDTNIRSFINSRFTVDEALAAYESSVAAHNVDVQQTPDSNLSPQTIDISAAVSGPGEPSIYYDADKSESNTEDDNLCWAATASNMLWHTGWASVTNARNEQEFFDTYFVNSWPDAGGNVETAISWFMNDQSYYGGSTNAYTFAGHYSQLMGQYGESPSDYVVVYSATESGVLQNLSASLAKGDAVGLSARVYSTQNGHAITCWGYAVNTSYSSTDPRYYAGLYITDSDDEKSDKFDDELNERKLLYIGLEWHDNLSRLSSNGKTVGGYMLDYNDRTGDNRYYLDDFQTLKQRPEKYALNPEARSTVVTTTDDVYDVFDGKISLREALVYAHPGDTITFDNSLKGKTITLNLENGELTISKSITIDASNLRSASTSAPGLTISGQGATRILSLNWGVKDVKINGIKFTNGGTSSSSGGAIYNYGATLSLDNCVISDNQASWGGAIYSAFGDTTLTNCVVTNNFATNYGGAVYAYSQDSYLGDTTLVNCTVTDNTAQFDGGGFYGNSAATLNAYNSIVYGNASAYRGADVADVYLPDGVSNAFNTLSSFSNWTNSEHNLTYDESKPLFTNATAGNYTLAENSQAIDRGDDLYVMTNVDFAGNRRISGEYVDLGAYEYQFSDPTPLPILSTPANVACAESSGAISVSWDSVQDAAGYRIAYWTSDESTTTVDVASHLTGYSLTGLTPGETYHVKVAALGDGVTHWTSRYSEEASARLSTVIVVTSAGDVSNADDGVVTLREALNAAKSGDKITFANSLKGKTIAVKSELDVYESVTIDASNLYTASSKTPGITISGGNTTRIMWIYGGYSVVIKGLKFTDGRASVCGGAVWNNGDLTVENCFFSDNIANNGSSYGGAIAVKPGAALIAKSSSFVGNVGAGVVSFQTTLSSSFTDCEFNDNECEAFYIASGKVLATNCSITDNNDSGVYIGSSGEASLISCNITGNSSNGIYAYNGEVSLTNCDIVENANHGIYVRENGILVATNCLVAGNSASYGAGIELYGTATLNNCTIVGNTAKYYGGGVELNGTAVLNTHNTIIVSNSAGYSGSDVHFYDSTVVANAYNTLSSFMDWTNGENNLAYDVSKPLFTNATSKDYTLAVNAQAIDKGNNQHVTTNVDLAGNPRISGRTVDLGAYEHQFTVDPVQLDTPSSPRETAKTEKTITVAWKSVPNASGYKLSWKNKSDSTFIYVDINADTTSYTLTDIDNGAIYDWRVLALGDGVNYADSAYTATRSVKPRQKLATPTASSNAESTSTIVSWNAVPNAVRYGVSYKLVEASTWSNDVEVQANLSYTINGLEPNTQYNVRVKAIGDGFDSGDSDYATLSVTTTVPPDEEPPVVASVESRAVASGDEQNELRIVFSESVQLQSLIDDGSIASVFQLTTGNKGIPISLGADVFKYDAATATLVVSLAGLDDATIKDFAISVKDGLAATKLALLIDSSRVLDFAGNALRGSAVSTGADAPDLVLFSELVAKADAFSAPSLHDWNGDGALDLVVGEKPADGAGRVKVYMNQGATDALAYTDSFYATYWDASASSSVEIAVSGEIVPQIADITGDGLDDLLVGLADGTIALYRGTELGGARVFSSPESVLVGAANAKKALDVGSDAGVEVFDWNGDGRNDLVVGATNGKIRVYLDALKTAGEYDFRSAATLAVGTSDLVVESGCSAPTIADVDGDGVFDLVSGNASGAMFVYRNAGTNASPKFKAPTPLLDASGESVTLGDATRSRPFAYDVNGDGVADYLVGSSDGSVGYYEGVRLVAPSSEGTPGAPFSCSISFPFELSDPSAPVYATPTIARFGVADSGELVLMWSTADPAEKYAVEYRLQGAEEWTGSGLFATLFGALPSANYGVGNVVQARVRAVASDVKGASDWSKVVQYKISGERPSISVATNVREVGGVCAVSVDVESNADAIGRWTIDWNDGSEPTSFVGLSMSWTLSHVYATSGVFTPVLYLDDQEGVALDSITVEFGSAAKLDAAPVPLFAASPTTNAQLDAVFSQFAPELFVGPVMPDRALLARRELASFSREAAKSLDRAFAAMTPDSDVFDPKLENDLFADEFLADFFEETLK